MSEKRDYSKCRWYMRYNYNVCGYYGYDECNDAQAQNCKEYCTKSRCF